jgi:hypothetical protein
MLSRLEVPLRCINSLVDANVVPEGGDVIIIASSAPGHKVNGATRLADRSETLVQALGLGGKIVTTTECHGAMPGQAGEDSGT